MVDHKPTSYLFKKADFSLCPGYGGEFNASAAFAKQVGDTLSRIKRYRHSKDR